MAKTVTLSLKNINLGSSSVTDPASTSFAADCKNEDTVEKSIKCPISSTHRNSIKSTTDVTYPFSSLNLNGYSLSAEFITDQVYDVDKGLINTEGNVDLTIEASSSWSYNGNTQVSKQVNSPYVFVDDKVTMTMSDETCLRFNLRDDVYELSIDYTADTYMQIEEDGNLLTGTSLSTAAAGIASSFSRELVGNNKVKFSSTGKIFVNLVLTTFAGDPEPLPCAANTQTLPPVLFPRATGAVNRFVISKDIGEEGFSVKTFSFTADQWNQQLNAINALNLYNILVVKKRSDSDDCFKLRIFIPVYIPLFIFFVFPLWIDASVVQGILSGFATALSTSTSLLNTALDLVEAVKSQISIKNGVLASSKAVAISKAIATGQANKQLLNIAKSLGNAVANLAKTLADLEGLKDTAVLSAKIMAKLGELTAAIARITPVLEVLGNSDSVTTRKIVGAIQGDAQDVVRLFKEFTSLVDQLPSNPLTILAKRMVKSIVILVRLLNTLTIEVAKTIVNDPDLVPVAVVKILTNKDVVSQLGDLASQFSGIGLAFNALSELVNGKELLKEGQEIYAIAGNQNQTEAEKAVENFALGAAASLDEYFGGAAEFLGLKDLENILFNGARDALAEVNKVSDQIEAAFSNSVEGHKRGLINERIRAIISRDLYQTSTTGSFDPRYPDIKQLVVNDLNGVRIYSPSGELLWEKRDFCNAPFTGIIPPVNAHGCQAGVSACDIGDWTCGELNFWYSIIKYRTSFSFRDNHDLSQGGVRVLKTGNDVDALWCHYPGSTKGYNASTANHIIYAPLNNRYAVGQTCSYDLVLGIDGWCREGIVKTGDFNGDKRDDALCIEDNRFLMLHGSKGSFVPASDTEDGVLSLNGINTGWNRGAKIVVGDFNGDGYKDLAKINQNTIDILYGNKDSHFVSNNALTASFNSGTSQSTISDCYNTNINRILTGDINNDGRDDIVCVKADDTKVTILSSIEQTEPIAVSAANYIQSRKRAVMTVKDIVLDGFDSSTSVNRVVHKDNTKIENLHKNTREFISDISDSHDIKVVNEVSYPHGCIGSTNIDTEASFVLSTKYQLPKSFIWQENDNGVDEIDIEVSAKWVDGNLVAFESNPLSSHDHITNVPAGLRYGTSKINSYMSLTINYQATVTMFVESEDGTLFRSKELLDNARDIVNGFTVDETGNSVSYPISGHININVLGPGYNDIMDVN